MQFWEKVMEKFSNKDKKDIFFFDDALSNVNTANSFWIKSFLYTNLKQFEEDLELIK